MSDSNLWILAAAVAAAVYLDPIDGLVPGPLNTALDGAAAGFVTGMVLDKKGATTSSMATNYALYGGVGGLVAFFMDGNNTYEALIAGAVAYLTPMIMKQV